MAKKYFIETFGCQMNDLDSEKIAGNLSSNGMEPVEDPKQADIIILNTCSVRDKAVQKAYARLGEIKRQKIQHRDLIVGVVGCMAQLEKENILKRAPFVDVLAGPQKAHVISDLIQRSCSSQTAAIEMRMDADHGPVENNNILRRNPWRASITISEGCNRSCAYCVVPLTRGREKVRPSENILREAEDLVSRGFIEILLLGQTVNSYVDHTVENMNFANLLRTISAIGGVKRIRFTSPHPADFSDELLEVMLSHPQVCSHLHLPVQSGSTRILRAMHRGYTREDYMELVRKIQNAGRPIAISSDFIVGFPGESERDFQDTLSLLDEVQFDSLYSFMYSPRPNTAALNLQDVISDKEKRRRLETLQKKQRHIQYKKNAAYVGQTLEVLADSYARNRVRLSGRADNNKIVNFDGPDVLMGQIIQVHITGFGPNSLNGVWIRPKPEGNRQPYRILSISEGRKPGMCSRLPIYQTQAGGNNEGN
jgi:tRNA-2-methylthio-N6-dimethylallyladenosine synthase